MAGNVQRSTTGRLLIVWATLLAGLVIFAWRVRLHADDYTWSEWPTGLGDRDYYTRLSDNDFYTPALVFTGHEKGVYRRKYRPIARDDAKMQRLSRDASNRVFVYVDPRKHGVVFLKTGENSYVEFGDRKIWPEYQPPKAIPVAAPPDQKP